MEVFKDSAFEEASRSFQFDIILICSQIGAQNQVSRSIAFRTYYEFGIRLVFFLMLYFF
ncbi:unnamed protein product [Acanthoscelides obtectus]|uniref:Uncharacterized protein n=1 Tax=Acanthoscelides obtectus TaxID=200917 RepID=A0A9P0QB00_ACAOB|nr:unnamed protein product [Acanthoscelides obtectus]CAH2016295.1 unnamed protein product [Acanthoscelides obtectus]CAK1656877.1 hypothetical protein AOBTE_LOCUS19987 [Acanthoscelides obtectus]CAK1656884.1 hypothetical protein AOBTE_LOCUS19994 [Acanthoscelides obtectus]